MQILLKTITAFIILIMMLLASCTSDLCYECLGFDGGTSVGEQDTLICADQFDSRAAFDDQVEIYEALGGICNEQ